MMGQGSEVTGQGQVFADAVTGLETLTEVTP